MKFSKLSNNLQQLQDQRCCNRFYYNWNGMNMMLPLLLTTFLVLTPPCRSEDFKMSNTVIETTTTSTPMIDINLGDEEIAVETTTSRGIINNEFLYSTINGMDSTTTRTDIQDTTDAAETTHDDNNEILSNVDCITNEHRTTAEFVSTNYQSALTENLEQTIRDSVKQEIELDQSPGTVAILNIIKNISDSIGRQQLVEDVLLHRQQKSLNLSTDNDIMQLNKANEESSKGIILSSSNLKDAKNQNMQSAHQTTASAKKENYTILEMETFMNESHLNMSDVHAIKKKVLLKHISPEDDYWQKSETTRNGGNFVELLEPQTALKADNSSSLDMLPTNTSDVIANNDVDEQYHNDEVLSVVLKETLLGTEQPVIENFNSLIDVDENEGSNHYTTVVPEKSIHNVIKKQGVDLQEVLIKNPMNKSIDVTTSIPEYNDKSVTEVNEDHNLTFLVTEYSLVDSTDLISISAIAESNISALLSNDEKMDIIFLKASTPSMVDQAKELESYSETTSTPAPELDGEPIDKNPNLSERQATGKVTTAKFDEFTSTKGSRSANQPHINSIETNFVDAVAATFFEAFAPHDIGQAFNDNLAAVEESTGEIRKALPNRSIANESTNRSTAIIVVCSSTAMVFIIISVTIFLISFQRQRGTLDIEMQEQRCGKDSMDEEEADTCTELLHKNTPSALLGAPADETDECL